MLAQSLSRFFIVVNFQANRNYIAEFLCVNKAKPELKCNGRCYLVKKMKLAESAEGQVPSSGNQTQKHKLESPLFYQPLFSAQAYLLNGVQDFCVFVPTRYIGGAPGSVFHPPQRIV